jgi:preprotein translocase subunit SecG
MATFLTVLAIIAALILFPAILFQAGQGGGLATQFGGGSSTDAFVGGRQATTILTKASWWAGGSFLAICFVLQLVSHKSGPQSLTQEELRRQAQQQAPSPVQQAAPLPLQSAPASQSAAPIPGAAKAPSGTTKRPAN